MNKEIIYIEPSDDVASLIAKIKKTDSKLVVLIPPKEAGVLHSIMNIKLIAKNIHDANKNLVIVTTDDSLIKLAAKESIPVAANLKTAPAVPTVDSEEMREIVAEDFVSEPEATGKLFEDSEKEESDEESEEDSEDDEKSKSKDESKKSAKGSFFATYRKWFIIGGTVMVLVGVFLFWALTIAPKVDLKISVKTSQVAFSENVNFVTKEDDEDSAKGKFYISEEKYEKESKVEFPATGERDDGEKATGTITVKVYLRSGSFSIPVGTSFTYSDLVYTATSAGSITYDPSKKCENEGDSSTLVAHGCLLSTSVKVSATKPGEKYNISAHNTGWTSALRGTASIVSDKAFTGGTSKIVRFVQQSDIDKAKEKLASADESVGRAKLMDQISDGVIAIDSSYKMETASPVSTPALNATVTEGTTPTLTAKTTFRIFTIDAVRVEEFIKEKAKIGDDRNIYSIGDPFIERFVELDNGYTAKLKTTYRVGPNVTEDSIRDKIYGKKIGEAKSLLNSINGVKSEINPSFFWVNKVPSDPNKVSIEINDTEE